MSGWSAERAKRAAVSFTIAVTVTALSALTVSTVPSS
jgi:hypothetical protein